MDIILPVGGLGTRLRPQTWSRPKPLVTVAGKPMLAHILDRVLPLGPDRIIFVTGFLGDQIEEWARANVPVPLAFVDQPHPRGQSDAILRTRDLGVTEALVVFPDMLFEADLSDLATAEVVMFTHEVVDPSGFGVAVVEDGRVVRLVEKPREFVSRLAVVGVYYFRNMPDLYAAIDDQVHRGIQLKNEYFLADAIEIMIAKGDTVRARPVGLWEDCGSTEALLRAHRVLLETYGATGTRVVGNSVVVEPSVVDPSATIERSVIGPYASVGPGATVRGAIVRDAIVEEGAVVFAAILDHAILGRKAEVMGRAASVNIGDADAVAL